MTIPLRYPGCITAIALFLTIISTAQAKYSGGTGETYDPYQIATAEDLMLLGETHEDYDKHFILTADIDLDPNLPGGKVFDNAVIAPDMNDVEYGFQGSPFAGVFDGKGHTISHLTVIGCDFVGLFGQLGLWDARSGDVRNLEIVDVDITGSGSYIGALVGFNEGYVSQCYSIGAVTGDGNDIGGLVGLNYSFSNVTQCHSTSTVSGKEYVGGLVGSNFGTVIQCYSTGAVTGDGNEIGGLVGRAVFPLGNQRALVGVSSDCFWDIQTSGKATSDGGTGLTTNEMQDINTFLKAGWDFVSEIFNGTCDYWQISPGDYPRLRYLAGDSPVMPEGFGTAEKPYLIRDVQDLGTVWFEPMAHYRLEASLDLSGITWSTAIISWFGGTFDGNGHTISHLTINGKDFLGLFGHLESGAEIKDLGVVDVNISGSGSYVGGLVGYNRDGTIANSYSAGTVTYSGQWGNVGGLVGSNLDGSITTSYSTAIVSGGWHVGGLVGSNYGSITGSYSTGTVTSSAQTCVGGLVGSNYGSITTSYSNGAVSGKYFVGGMVGNNNYGSVTTSYSTGAVTAAGWYVGGLVGYNYYGTIAASYSTGMVSGTGSDVGGLVGSNSGSIATSYSTGAVSGTERIGGLVGGNSSAVTQCSSTGTVSGTNYVGGLVGCNSNSGRIATSCSTGTVSGNQLVGGLVGYNLQDVTYCYSTSMVDGNDCVAGLVGLNGGPVTQCYSTGAVSGTSYVGGLVGYNTWGKVTKCLWDIQTSGQTKSAGGTGKTTAEMQTASTFLEAGWDFVDETANGTEDIWWILEGQDYPRLWWEMVPEN